MWKMFCSKQLGAQVFFFFFVFVFLHFSSWAYRRIKQSICISKRFLLQNILRPSYLPLRLCVGALHYNNYIKYSDSFLLSGLEKNSKQCQKILLKKKSVTSHLVYPHFVSSFYSYFVYSVLRVISISCTFYFFYMMTKIWTKTVQNQIQFI